MKSYDSLCYSIVKLIVILGPQGQVVRAASVWSVRWREKPYHRAWRLTSRASSLAGKAVPPGMEVDEPGKLVDSMRRADQGFAPPVVAMLRAASALRKGEVSGHVGEASGAASDPPLPPISTVAPCRGARALRCAPKQFVAAKMTFSKTTA